MPVPGDAEVSSPSSSSSDVYLELLLEDFLEDEFDVWLLVEEESSEELSDVAVVLEEALELEELVWLELELLGEALLEGLADLLVDVLDSEDVELSLVDSPSL